MAKTLKISVGIPVRNGERFLWEAINSAVRQTRPADQILVMDDASSDASAQIAKSGEWGDRIDYVFNNNPTGFADAFNRLANLATGDFLTILCADDILEQDCLARLEEGILCNPNSKFCHAGFRYLSESGEPLGGAPEPYSATGKLVPGRVYTRRLLEGVMSGADIHRCIAFLVETSLIREACPFRREAGLIADTDFLVRVASHTDVVRITKPLASVRIHPQSLSNQVGSLPLQLATDYLFQLSHSSSDGTDSEITAIWRELSQRFIRALFSQAIRAGRSDLLNQALRLQKKLDGFTDSSAAAKDFGTVLRRYAASNPIAAGALRAATKTIAKARQMKDRVNERLD